MPRPVLAAIVAVWAIAVAIGMALLLEYKNTPGAAADGSATWPAASELVLATDAPTLVMFAHPRCTCTRASLTELAAVMAKSPHVRAHVVFMQPSDLETDWAHTAIWEQAEAIRGVDVSLDRDAAEARRFGAHTSGTVMIFGPSGRLLFAGGLTASRGHVGDSLGRERVETLLATGEVDERTAQVFGCALMDPEP